MSGDNGPTLDSEGVPDLEGPLPEKEATGDPQEGIAPPGDRPRATVDWGITADEQREVEPLDVRIGRELPDIGATDPVDEVVEDLGLDAQPLDDIDEPIAVEDGLDGVLEDEASDLVAQQIVGDDLLADDEKDAVAVALPAEPGQGWSAEEAALHVVDDDDI
jgi:hypothetical protein